MGSRRFENFTVDVERVTLTNAPGTLQKIGTYAAVTGMTGVLAAIQEDYKRKVDTELGDSNEVPVIIVIDVDQLPAGTELRIGDRVKDTELNITYTVESVALVEGRLWQCRGRKKTA